MKVANMESPRTGSNVPNQFIITDDTGTEFFQSYTTIIASKSNEGIILDTNALNYSKTTSKYLYQFLGMNRKAIENAIENGLFTIKDMN